MKRVRLLVVLVLACTPGAEWVKFEATSDWERYELDGVPVEPLPPLVSPMDVDPRSVLEIVCTGDPLPWVRVQFYQLRVNEGRARIDDRPPTSLVWRGNLASLAAVTMGGNLEALDGYDLREQLRTGQTLTVEAVTAADTLYFRFDLEGFGEHEQLCASSTR